MTDQRLFKPPSSPDKLPDDRKQRRRFGGHRHTDPTPTSLQREAADR